MPALPIYARSSGRARERIKTPGHPIEDAQQEIERIRARAFEAAARLADATGDNAAVRAHLGLPEADIDSPDVPLVERSDHAA
ncbi:hypothetical protein ACFT7S_00100 [Streptomyces sp. NPDC057136]|uniref:hypothetical protein n=1 Tax=Streptomyces sp. NPDC057136 TaxID=3346029 RepID=UPI003637418C